MHFAKFNPKCIFRKLHNDGSDQFHWILLTQKQTNKRMHPKIKPRQLLVTWGKMYNFVLHKRSVHRQHTLLGMQAQVQAPFHPCQVPGTFISVPRHWSGSRYRNLQLKQFYICDYHQLCHSRQPHYSTWKCAKLRLLPKLCLGPCWGSWQASPDSLAGFKGRGGR